MKVDLSGRRGLAAGDLTFWVAASLVGGDPKGRIRGKMNLGKNIEHRTPNIDFRFIEELRMN